MKRLNETIETFMWQCDQRSRNTGRNQTIPEVDTQQNEVFTDNICCYGNKK